MVMRTNPHNPCPSRFHHVEEGITYGCLRNAANGHGAGTTNADLHQNGGLRWATDSGGARLANRGGVRCESIIEPNGDVAWRCVEDAGHYPGSIHVKTGFPPKGWTDEMSTTPPQEKPERHPARRDRIMDEAERLTAIWRDLGPVGRRMVNEHVGRDLYKALHALAIEVEERVPLKTIEDDAPAGAPAPWEDPEPAGYPAEKRIADLEGFLEARHVRREALHHARKSWGKVFVEDGADDGADRHARGIVIIAQVFEKYLTGNAKDEETTS